VTVADRLRRVGLARTEEVTTMSDTTVGAGTPLPDFILPKLDGGELDLAELRGKKVLLFFWGSW
jgi:hypothetical protein